MFGKWKEKEKHCVETQNQGKMERKVLPQQQHHHFSHKKIAKCLAIHDGKLEWPSELDGDRD